MEEEHDLPVEDIIDVISKKIKTPNFLLLSHVLKPLSERNGLLGDHRILKVIILLDPNIMKAEDEDDIKPIKKEISFFVKFFPKNPAPAKFAEGTGAFKKEIFIYTLLEDFKKFSSNLVEQCVSNCYSSKTDYLIFDNLLDEDYKSLDARKTLSYDEVLVVLNSLAKMHASSIIYEEQMSRKFQEIFRLNKKFSNCFEESFYNEKKGFVNEKEVEGSIECVLKEIDLFEQPTKLLSGKDFKATVKDLSYKIYELVKPSKTYRNVLCHGDCWTTNFLLKYDSKKALGCKLVDFQCARYVPPAQDLMAMLHLSTTRKFRKDNLYTLCGIYYATIEKILKVAGFDIKLLIPFNDFMQSCEEQKLFAIVQTATYFPLILVKKEVIDEYFSNKELDQVESLTDRSKLVLDNISNDIEYKNRLEESIQDFRDYCELL